MDSENRRQCESYLNASDFDPETFVGNLILKKGLDELVAVEEDMVENVRRLDSEMQHLVYENYNKFLTATNAVRKMQRDFKDIEENLDSLSAQMMLLHELSLTLSNEFGQNREAVSNLKDSTVDYKILSYIVSMPTRLQKLINKGKIDRAVLVYSKLMQSMRGNNEVNFMSSVVKEVQEIMGSLETKLRQKLENTEDSIDYVHTARLLSLMPYNGSGFLDSLIKQWGIDLNSEMDKLEKDSFKNDGQAKFSDVLDNVERGVCPFLTNVSLAIARYSDLFNKPVEGEMSDTVSAVMKRLKLFLIKLFVSDTNAGCALYVRALDKAFRKICAVCKLLEGFEFEKENTEFVFICTQHQLELCRASVTINLKLILAEMFDVDGDQRVLTQSVQLVRRLESSFLTSVKSSLANLLLFAASDVTFFNNSNSAFSLSSFGIDVHEQVVVGCVRDIQVMSRDVKRTMHLAFAAFLNFARKHIKYLMDLCAEQYSLTEQIVETLLTNSVDLLKDIHETGILSLRGFVQDFAPIIKKVLTSLPSWTVCNTAPVAVREEVKQFVDEVRHFDSALRTLLDDNTTKERMNVDSSRRLNRRLNASPQNADKNSSNSLEKMWAETVDDFYEPVLEFKRQAVLGCIIYKSLRLYLDWLRGHSFTMFGVQQLQIDSFYFKQNLWHFAADEMSINILIDELLTLAVNVCENPKLLEPAVVRDICNR